MEKLLEKIKEDHAIKLGYKDWESCINDQPNYKVEGLMNEISESYLSQGVAEKDKQIQEMEALQTDWIKKQNSRVRELEAEVERLNTTLKVLCVDHENEVRQLKSELDSLKSEKDDYKKCLEGIALDDEGRASDLATEVLNKYKG